MLFANYLVCIQRIYRTPRQHFHHFYKHYNTLHRLLIICLYGITDNYSFTVHWVTLHRWPSKFCRLRPACPLAICEEWLSTLLRHELMTAAIMTNQINYLFKMIINECARLWLGFTTSSAGTHNSITKYISHQAWFGDVMFLTTASSRYYFKVKLNYSVNCQISLRLWQINAFPVNMPFYGCKNKNTHTVLSPTDTPPIVRCECWL